MTPRTTLREIAACAGVHFTTVSRALRNHPGLPVETRRKLQDLAAKMGYVPDPLVSALNAYRLAKQRVTYHGTIGWLDGYPPGKVHSTLMRGAMARAAQLGYRIERFELGSQPVQELRSLDRVMTARNIRNLIVHPFNANTRIELDWERYSAIAIGHQLVSPRLHLVTNDQSANLMLAMRRLTALGYRRIGLLLEQRLIHITGVRWLAGYLAERENAPPGDRLEFLVFDEPAPESVLRAWFRRNRPDAIITETGFWTHRLHGDLGLRCPRDLGVALVSTNPSTPFAGIVENSARVGAVAVEQLVRIEHSDERGVPGHPLHLFIQGDWKDGPSVAAAAPGLKTPAPRTTPKTPPASPPRG